ncbi:MAG: glucoamylase family protein [Thermomonas sp.]|uniref:glucoamylase family protein n=1 Tax=Thermomonas sp. TaxID=1971895 RepID=UPI0039E3B2DD
MTAAIRLPAHVALLGAACALAFAIGGCKREATPAEAMPAPQAATQQREVPELVADLQRRTFDWFWEVGNPDNGLVPDRWPTPSASSVAAVGFGLTAYGVGVERGWISREQAVDRTLATLRFFARAPQGQNEQGAAGYKGFFYHFLELDNGLRSGTNEVSTVDTSLLLGGILFAQSYYDRDDRKEADIRRLADKIYRRVDWTWAQARKPLISMGWKPEEGMLPYDWQGYNEALLVYVLALGSPTHPVGEDAYVAWSAHYDRTWGKFHEQEHLSFPPLFGHQYSHVWIDFRGIQDAYTRGKGIDYFENSRRAAYSQQAYAVDNPNGWRGYGKTVWGLTACDGPIDASFDFDGTTRLFRTYAPRGAGIEYALDDGTIAPTAAAGSIAFAPEIAIPAIEAMHEKYGKDIYGEYGFLDAFNPSFTFADAPLKHGRVTDSGWVDGDYLGIDQGPIVLMIENYRSDFVWKVMRRNPYIQRGLQRAGFRGGWLDALPKQGEAKASSPDKAG